MNTILWTPKSDRLTFTQMDQFREFVNQREGKNFTHYQELYDWSIHAIAEFWAACWEFTEILSHRPYRQVVDDPKKMPGAKWFAGSRLNYAENLLRYRDEHIALYFQGEGQPLQSITYNQLFREVEKVAQALRTQGVKAGDRVAGFMPNRPETVIAMLATASIGAIWSSSSPDFGIKGVLDRFSQIEPKILFAADGYFYNGKVFNSLDKLKSILSRLPSVKKVVVVPYTRLNPDISHIKNGVLYRDFLPVGKIEPLQFEQLPFDHPLYIMYSSGTTGLPKSIVHSAGGTLIQHLKELRLHTDLKREDTIFYFTTCGWMMWNWLVTSLAAGATVVLYDGSPFFPNSGAMWQLAQDLGITVLGTSAKFIAACEAAGEIPTRHYNLKSLRAILSTGSPLLEESFDYVYDSVKSDVQLASISGGTDLISCFALGNPTLPVYRGELQCRGLGMAVNAFDVTGKPVLNQKGELVCTKAFPSMPIYFWNDPEGEKYQQAYFQAFPGVWHHGDYIEINDHGGVKIYGRSDATLNPGGVRIGTAEIYRVVEALPGISDSLVVGQKWKQDERVILFVKLNPEVKLDEQLVKKIKTAIREQCSPRHVPSKILPVADIPYTINGKKVEVAIKKIIHGQSVANRDALANPESLEFYRDLKALTE
ncbi:MAG: acetoacetate--CoA ligase [Fidelibacterota bacterium]